MNPAVLSPAAEAAPPPHIGKAPEKFTAEDKDVEKRQLKYSTWKLLVKLALQTNERLYDTPLK